MAAGADEAICPECKVKVKDTEMGIQCDGFCDLWHHPVCVGIDNKDYKKIQELNDKIKWMCVDCSGMMKTMRTKVSVPIVKDYISDHLKVINNISQTLKDFIKDSIFHSINKRLDKIEENYEKVISMKSIDSKVNSNTSSVTDDSNSRSAKPDVSQSLQTSPNTNSSLGSVTQYWDEVGKQSSVNQNISYATALKSTQARIGREDSNHQDLNRHAKNKSSNSKATWRNNRNGNIGNGYRKSIEPKTTASTRLGNDRDRRVVVGTSENTSLSVGERKAWLYLGRLKNDTSEDDVKNFVLDTFPGVNVSVEKLESKGTNASFKLGVDFDVREDLFNSAAWPKDSIIKRFLFKRTRTRNLE
jgi:hypothetical protein